MELINQRIPRNRFQKVQCVQDNSMTYTNFQGNFIDIGNKDGLSLYEIGVKVAQKLGFFMDDKDIANEL